MRGIADEQQAVSVPLVQPIELHIKEFHVIPTSDGVRAVGQPWHHFGDPVAQHLYIAAAHLRVGALANEISTLEVVAAVEQHHESVGADSCARSLRITGMLGEAEPPNIDRHAELPWTHPRRGAQRRATAIASDGEIGLERTGFA
ncbi:Uncharacterised protein [Mycobacteroides abscessus subsp. abscessus]|nr:Uncharacterised protein [Mycobacteroides abscessus subsp. abscessus]